MNYLEFKEIPSFSSYRINRLGQIWSDKSNKFMKPFINNHGYQQTRLTNDEGKQQTIRFHQLVAITFLGHKPNGHILVVDHINYNKLDNRLSNLQLISNRENLSKDAYRTKKTGLPLGISTKRGGTEYMFAKQLNNKQFRWAFKAIEQAIEMKEMFDYLNEAEGLEYAINTLNDNRAGSGRGTNAEINGDIIKIG